MKISVNPMTSKRYTIPEGIKGSLLLMVPSEYQIEDYKEDSFYPDWVIVPELKYPILLDLSEIKRGEG